VTRFLTLCAIVAQHFRLWRTPSGTLRAALNMSNFLPTATLPP
jgi:hypothetical protein